MPWRARSTPVGLLAERGDLAGLAARADDGDSHAARELVGLLAKHGDVDTLRARADEGDVDAARELAGLLAGRGDLDGLGVQAQQQGVQLRSSPVVAAAWLIA